MDKAGAVGIDRRISSNIFADVWGVDRLCEGIGFLHEWLIGVLRAYRHAAKKADKSEYGENVGAESMIATRGDGQLLFARSPFTFSRVLSKIRPFSLR